MKIRIALILSALLLASIANGQQPAPAQPATPPSAPLPTAITRSQIENRIAQLKQIHEQAVAQLNALEGAQQELERLLETLAPAPPKEARPAPPR